jgi:hypothetical protein
MNTYGSSGWLHATAPPEAGNGNAAFFPGAAHARASGQFWLTWGVSRLGKLLGCSALRRDRRTKDGLIQLTHDARPRLRAVIDEAISIASSATLA